MTAAEEEAACGRAEELNHSSHTAWEVPSCMERLTEGHSRTTSSFLFSCYQERVSKVILISKEARGRVAVVGTQETQEYCSQSESYNGYETTGDNPLSLLGSPPSVLQ